MPKVVVGVIPIWWLIRSGYSTCNHTLYGENIYKYIHIYQPLHSRRIWHEVNLFKAEFNRFVFRVFHLWAGLVNQSWRTQSALLFTHSWRENNRIHTFPKGISVMWNAISLVQVWTHVAMSIYYNNNHYMMDTSIIHTHTYTCTYISLCVCVSVYVCVCIIFS